MVLWNFEIIHVISLTKPDRKIFPFFHSISSTFEYERVQVMYCKEWASKKNITFKWFIHALKFWFISINFVDRSDLRTDWIFKARYSSFETLNISSCLIDGCGSWKGWYLLTGFWAMKHWIASSNFKDRTGLRKGWNF